MNVHITHSFISLYTCGAFVCDAFICIWVHSSIISADVDAWCDIISMMNVWPITLNQSIAPPFPILTQIFNVMSGAPNRTIDIYHINIIIISYQSNSLLIVAAAFWLLMYPNACASMSINHIVAHQCNMYSYSIRVPIYHISAHHLICCCPFSLVLSSAFNHMVY